MFLCGQHWTLDALGTQSGPQKLTPIFCYFSWGLDSLLFKEQPSQAQTDPSPALSAVSATILDLGIQPEWVFTQSRMGWPGLTIYENCKASGFSLALHLSLSCRTQAICPLPYAQHFPPRYSRSSSSRNWLLSLRNPIHDKSILTQHERCCIDNSQAFEASRSTKDADSCAPLKNYQNFPFPRSGVNLGIYLANK